LTKRREGKVLVLELARPKEGNALNRALQRELSAAWRELEDDDGVVAAVLHGSEGVFSIGHDSDELAEGQGAEASPVPEEGLFPLSLTKPVIAAVEGPCYGLAFELALSCDLRIAGEGSMFGFPDKNLHVPYRVASVLLPRMTFVGLALEMLFAGHVLDARRMQDSRLVSRVVPQRSALAAALEAAGHMVERFGSVAAFRKQNVWRLSGLPLPAAMELARAPLLAGG
jgi:enoyl-CoA hydratase